VISDERASIFYGYGDTQLQKYWFHEFDLWGSRDVIDHVTVGSARLWHSDTLSKTKALLSWRVAS